ncbi:MAG: hypothetical protein EPN39_20295 [Chitinophagaceae bacterium]|nr:MAG: hypothetical protein EPN39_20295 [Chitinophagaceae bacterium]
MEPLDIVNKYLDIIFSKKGDGLPDILVENFSFDDPFTVVRSADEFTEKCAGWVQVEKSILMEKQFLDGNQTCSIYTIEARTPSGSKERFQLADYIEVQDDQISKERVYFFDQVAFAASMGFKDVFLKKYF